MIFIYKEVKYSSVSELEEIHVVIWRLVWDFASAFSFTITVRLECCFLSLCSYFLSCLMTANHSPLFYSLWKRRILSFQQCSMKAKKRKPTKMISPDCFFLFKRKELMQYLSNAVRKVLILLLHHSSRWFCQSSVSLLFTSFLA